MWDGLDDDSVAGDVVKVLGMGEDEDDARRKGKLRREGVRGSEEIMS
jgi:hypothetical protein